MGIEQRFIVKSTLPALFIDSMWNDPNDLSVFICRFWCVLTKPWFAARHHSLIAIPKNSGNLSTSQSVTERSGKQ